MIIDYIINDFKSFISDFSLVVLLFSGFIYVIRKISDNLINRNLESFKGEINEKLEEVKNNHQKNLREYELFAKQRHNKYPEMYKYIETAYGHVMGLRGLNRYLTFEDVDETDLNIYFEELQMTNYNRVRLIQLFKQNKEKAIEEIRKQETILKWQNARMKWVEANDFFIYNQLYFSDEVSAACKNLLDNLFRYKNQLEPGEYLTPKATKENTKLRQELLPSYREELKQKMKDELKVAYNK
jgi:hypothetical protein